MEQLWNSNFRRGNNEHEGAAAENTIDQIERQNDEQL